MARWRRAGPHRARVRPPPLKCRPTGLVGPGVTSSDIRVTSRGPWLAQGPRPRAPSCPRHPGTPLERGGGARGRRGGGLGAGRGAHRAAPGARGRRNRSETAQVPLGETVQGDPGDPPGRSETPSSGSLSRDPLLQVRSLGLAALGGSLDWPAGTFVPPSLSLRDRARGTRVYYFRVRNRRPSRREYCSLVFKQKIDC